MQKIALATEHHRLGKLSNAEERLSRYEGVIGSAVNHGSTHWGVVFVVKEGNAFYFDSLGWNADSRIQMIAQLVSNSSSLFFQNGML